MCRVSVLACICMRVCVCVYIPKARPQAKALVKPKQKEGALTVAKKLVSILFSKTAAITVCTGTRISGTDPNEPICIELLLSCHD